jgi:hypothetical protein
MPKLTLLRRVYLLGFGNGMKRACGTMAPDLDGQLLQLQSDFAAM